MTVGEERFSLLYLRNGILTQDSARMRVRLGHVFQRIVRSRGAVLRNIWEKLGINGPPAQGNKNSIDWLEFFKSADIRDILDVITFGWAAGESSEHAEEWRAAVEQIFREEEVCYRIDERGVVHFLVDPDFEAHRAATLAGLGAARYRAARELFESAHRALDGDPADTLAAVRGVFDAVENVFKLLTDNKATRLGDAEVKRHLGPLLSVHNPQANDAAAAGRMVASFGDWINGAHHYRHAPGEQDPAPPPLQLAVLIMSNGAAFLRWLVDLDTVVRTQQN